MIQQFQGRRAEGAEVIRQARDHRDQAAWSGRADGNALLDTAFDAFINMREEYDAATLTNALHRFTREYNSGQLSILEGRRLLQDAAALGKFIRDTSDSLKDGDLVSHAQDAGMDLLLVEIQRLHAAVNAISEIAIVNQANINQTQKNTSLKAVLAVGLIGGLITGIASNLLTSLVINWTKEHPSVTQNFKVYRNEACRQFEFKPDFPSPLVHIANPRSLCR